VLAYARHLADDEARQPCGGDHLRRLRRKLDLGEDEIAVPELVDLPGEIPVRQAVALFDDAVTGGEGPEVREGLGRALLLDCGAAQAGAELHAADEPQLAVRPAHPPEAFLQPLAGDPALLDLDDFSARDVGHTAQQVFPLDLDVRLDADTPGELDDLA